MMAMGKAIVIYIMLSYFEREGGRKMTHMTIIYLQYTPVAK